MASESCVNQKFDRISAGVDQFTGNGASGQEKLPAFCPGQYIACLYDGHWWCGSIIERSEEYGDYKVKFMHPHGPCKIMKWPSIKDDICWVPAEHILQGIPAPVASSSGRNYTITESTVNSINKKLSAVIAGKPK